MEREKERERNAIGSLFFFHREQRQREPALDRFCCCCCCFGGVLTGKSQRERERGEKTYCIVFFDLEQPETDRQRRTPLDCYSSSTVNIHNPHFDHSATTAVPPLLPCHVPSGFLMSTDGQRGSFQRDRLVQSVLHGITKGTTGSDESAEVCWGNRKGAPLGLS